MSINVRDRTELGTDVVEVERHRKDEINCEGCFMMGALSFEIDTTVKRNTTTVNPIPASKTTEIRASISIRAPRSSSPIVMSVS